MKKRFAVMLAALLAAGMMSTLPAMADDAGMDELIAAAEVFGIDWNGDQGTAYVSLMVCEFVALKGKAYLMSSTSGEAIIRFVFDGQYPKFVKLEWSRSGTEHDKWIEEKFPAKYLEEYKKSKMQDLPGENEIEKQIRKAVKELMDVPIEIEDLLEIDLEKETYEIIRIYEGFDENGEYQFDFDTIDKGSLNEVPESTK